MSEIVEIKVRIDAAKKDRYDAHCAALGVSRNIRLNSIIDADLDGKIAAEQVMQPPARHLSESDKLRSDFAPLTDTLQAHFADNKANMSRLLSPLQSVASVALTEKRFDSIEVTQKKLAEQVGQSQAALQKSLDAIEACTKKLGADLKIERPALHHDGRFLGGLAAGVLGLIFLVTIFPGTWGPARGFAKLAIGESDTVRAAVRLAGRGDKTSEAIIFASLQLSNDDAFIDSFRACIDAANRTTKPTRCKLDMPGLKSDR